MSESESTAPMIPGAEVNPPRPSPEIRARRLEEKADAIRKDVDQLMRELDRRRHRAVRTYLRPTLVGVVIAGVAAVAVLVWRSARRRPSRTISDRTKALARMALALRRAATHPERVAVRSGPSVGKHVATAAISLGSLLAGQLIKRRLRTDQGETSS